MRWLSVLVLVIAIAASLVAALLFAAGFVDDVSAPIFGVKVPSGYRQWELVAVSHETDLNELRGIVGNPKSTALSLRATHLEY